jgi:hypothetical protein
MTGNPGYGGDSPPAGRRLGQAAQGWFRFAVGDPDMDWLRHLAGLPCHQQVTSHEFTSGRGLGYRASRCVWIPSVTADWCRVPRRCHALLPSPQEERP